MGALVGQSLDRYQILELLGEGGMGAVYRARDVTLQRDVAIKVLHQHIARQADFEARFLQEARSAARLDHPGIVQVHDFHRTQDTLYIVMKLIPGANLREMLEDLKAQDAWLPLDEAEQLVQQVCMALDYAHRKGVLHRDIKPKNIMIEPEPSNGLPYRPVLTDLGLAKLAEGGIETRAGSSMGTPAYMSPEQALGQKTDARSDVYSLGILLYELSTGQVPFPAKTITEAIRYHTRTAPAPPRSLRPDIPVALEHIILQALEKDPLSRFQNAASLADALQRITPEITQTVRQTQQQGAVSLMTQYQRSLENPRGASILQEFDTPTDLSQDSIQVMVNDEIVDTLAITKERLTLGRRDDCDIVLQDAKASRQHARVEFTGSDYHIVDLDSRNGTYLDNARLLPGMAEVWRPAQPVRIGDTWLRLSRADVISQDATFNANRSYAGAERAVNQAISSVGMLLDNDQLAVSPGASVAITVNLLNQGSLVDHLHLSVDGIPAEWVSIPPTLVHLMPGQQQSISIVLHPPKTPQSRAGQHPVTISATSQNNPDHVAQASAIIDITPYQQYLLDLRPQKQTSLSDGHFTVQVTNQCNSTLTFNLTAIDSEDACHFTFFPSQVVVDAGQTQDIQLNVLSKTPLTSNAARTYTFTVTANIKEAQDLTQQVHGMWVQSPPIFELQLQPVSQRSENAASYTLTIANLGQTTFTAQVSAADPANACVYKWNPTQGTVAPGQKGAVKLDVSPISTIPLHESRTHTFTITVQPSEMPGYAKQVQGTWEQLAPPPPTPQEAVTFDPLPHAKQPRTAKQDKPERNWLGGCLFAIFGLLITAFLAWLAGAFTYEQLNLGNGEAWVAFGIVALIGLVITIKITTAIYRGKVKKR